ncbi:hypothetical protein [Flavobacterium reichenbachii]|uniref:Uncharacterized protein n=1 Tax=Flavobacterium reichenbachii TaxID=362418 RepID=A0A085ZRA5_9FLAO|nr:hypothetical protein [Flavobacterium reichenbachii]KFF06969.1 hypothetical protein IW19_16265 [Flavobacterium reichenbachii]OXB12056.1 hypothetical protein B0A68_20230 [Flavobacterium reichenbachii]
MKQFKIIIVVFVLFGLFGFSGEALAKVREEVPADFYFVIEDGGNDYYNSQNNNFHRKYVKEERVIKVKLTKDEKEKIYSLILKSKFFEMPTKFEPTDKKNIVITSPSFLQSILIKANGKNKLVSYNTGFTSNKNDEKAKRFLELYNMIWGILYKKEGIKKMPKSDYFYE